MGIVYDLGDEVKEYVDKMIADYHPLLADCRIGYLFRTPVLMDKGREVVAKISKFPPKFLPLFKKLYDTEDENMDTREYVYLIEVSHEIWVDLSEAERYAVMDHELCHCDVEEQKDGSMKYSLVGHDYEEFDAVIKRHGIYTGELETLATTILGTV